MFASRDFVVQACLFLGKLFSLNIYNVAYPKGRVNDQVTDFKLHEILLNFCLITYVYLPGSPT